MIYIIACGLWRNAAVLFLGFFQSGKAIKITFAVGPLNMIE
ncbi:hypothetical protein HMPREF0061_0846 [Aerococcus viridans ATCC 11563 = CCUG 4311]|uniref:Uncharacterized protein n=1 Tax=Aerococcus viridans (strain ATCC 11563 / DSM 20340 / CCUG 4311 / JCM 20461 / NBRC 12219 / NCTC 8251 / M1) TaxID=655812 RepID=A0ABP2I7F2_AERVM|nr:hypothetical protein HMPREF0061_0846 [Aerococcus viridans ATCC 11563 = CCUG 4311]